MEVGNKIWLKDAENAWIKGLLINRTTSEEALKGSTSSHELTVTLLDDNEDEEKEEIVYTFNSDKELFENILRCNNQGKFYV